MSLHGLKSDFAVDSSFSAAVWKRALERREWGLDRSCLECRSIARIGRLIADVDRFLVYGARSYYNRTELNSAKTSKKKKKLEFVFLEQKQNSLK
jgi:hypothetical protein